MTLVHLETPGRRRQRELCAFLPTSREELCARGWDQLDVLIVTGDAYVSPNRASIVYALRCEGETGS